MNNQETKKYIIHCGIFLAVAFLTLFCYLFYIQVIEGDALATNPLNHRSNANQNIVRGSIVDANGEILAESSAQAPRERNYPYGAIMMPVTGYLGENIGSAGLEHSLGDELSGQSRDLQKLGPIGQLLQGQQGNSVHLTVDADIQELAYQALGSHRGAVVVMDAKSGAVIALVSKPSANPNDLEENWEQLSQRKDSPLLNRASQGLYPPGSTIKVLIADAALDEKVTDLNETFDCKGYLDLGNNEAIHESHGAVHNKIDLQEALTQSCNVTFGTLAMRMHGQGLGDAFKRFGFYDHFNSDIDESTCHLPDFNQLMDGDTAQIGIGQGTLLITPLRMAMLAASYGNGGKMMVPYMVDTIYSPQGVLLQKHTPVEWRRVTTEQRAALIYSYMENVVKHGTGRNAAVSGIKVAGKTGTAENSAGIDHGWFMGTAELSNRTIAFCVIVENSGEGGAYAAPIARQIISRLQEKS